MFPFLWQWLQQISREAKEGTYNCYSGSITQAIFPTVMEVPKDFDSINIFIRWTMFFFKSLIVFCCLPLVLLLFTLHMSFGLYLYKGKSNNKTQPSLTNFCIQTTQERDPIAQWYFTFAWFRLFFSDIFYNFICVRLQQKQTIVRLDRKFMGSHTLFLALDQILTSSHHCASFMDETGEVIWI